MADSKVTATSGNYSPKGDRYRGVDGSWYKTLPRRKAGWKHILDAHEGKKSQ